MTFRAGYIERVKAITTVHSRLFEFHSLSHLEQKSRHLAALKEILRYSCRLLARVRKFSPR